MDADAWGGSSKGSADWIKWKLEMDLARQLGSKDSRLRSAARNPYEAKRTRLAYLALVGACWNRKQMFLKVKLLQIERDKLQRKNPDLPKVKFNVPVRPPKIPSAIQIELDIMDLAGSAARISNYSELALMQLAAGQLPKSKWIDEARNSDESPSQRFGVDQEDPDGANSDTEDQPSPA